MNRKKWISVLLLTIVLTSFVSNVYAESGILPGIVAEPTASASASSLATGTYYINNLYNRAFLGHETYAGKEKLVFKKGNTSSFGSNSIWSLQLTTTGRYYITNTFVLNGSTVTYYLQYTPTPAVSVNGYVTLKSRPSNIGYALWDIVQEDEGYRIVNQYSQSSLHILGEDVYLSSSSSVSQYTNNYYWRIVDATEYQSKELTGITANSEYNVYVSSSTRLALTQTTPSGTGTNVAMFTDADDFTVVGDSEAVFSWGRLSYMFTFTPYECSRMTITITHRPTNNSVTFVLNVIPASGHYLIRNAQHNKYIIESSPLVLTTLGYNKQSACDINLVSYGSGYYYLKTQSNKCITVVESAGGSMIGIDLADQVSGSSTQLWKFIATGENQFILQSKYDPSKVLCTSTVMNSMTLYLDTYTDNSVENDEWLIYQKTKPTFAIPGVDAEDGQNLSYAFNEEQRNSSFGHANTYRYLDSDWALSTMQESFLYIFSGHSDATNLILNSENLTYNQIAALPSNALASTELVLFLSCSAGEGGTTANNLVTITASKGADVVIGFNVEILVDKSLRWGKYFLSYLLDSQTVEAAMLYADANITNLGHVGPNYRVIIGDISAVIFE